MNCPSRTDDVESKHPGWNQNPPYLAADLTTCQDLNGIANAREVKAGGGEVNSMAPVNEPDHPARPPDPAISIAVARSLLGNSSPNKTVAGGDGCNRLSVLLVTQHPWFSALRDWVTWGISVAVSAFLLSTFGRRRDVSAHVQMIGSQESNSPVSVPLRKRASCAPNGNSKDEYNTPLHAGAVFIIMFVSAFACSFPLLAIRFPRLRLPGRFFFIVRHFGTGVLLATAFVHLLPTAFILLGDPCLSSFWSQDYPAMPGAIAMVGIFLITLIEMVFHPSRHVRPAGDDVVGSDVEAKNDVSDAPTQHDPQASVPVRSQVALSGKRASISRSLSRVRDQNGADEISRVVNPTDKTSHEVDVDERGSVNNPKVLTPEQRHRKAILQCVMLEMGILFHSVFIGMALSVSVGNEFVILLIAIAFHQTFEGLALGSRIACIVWPTGSLQPWYMALAYGCTTPVGQAIGIATHSLYSPDSEVGLLLVGTMNAISAGFLIFASLIELLSEDFLSDDSWTILVGVNRVWACVLVLAGAFAMSLVGAWA